MFLEMSFVFGGTRALMAGVFFPIRFIPTSLCKRLHASIILNYITQQKTSN